MPIMEQIFHLCNEMLHISTSNTILFYKIIIMLVPTPILNTLFFINRFINFFIELMYM